MTPAAAAPAPPPPARMRLPRTLRVARGAHIYAALISLVLLLFLPPPWRATAGEQQSFAALALTLLAAVLTAVGLTRRRRFGWWAAVAVGAWYAIGLPFRLPIIVQNVRAGLDPQLRSGLVLTSTVWLALLVGLILCLATPGWRRVLR